MRRIGVGVVVLGVVAATTTAQAAQAEPRRGADRPTTTITLVTGDEVVLVAGEAKQVRPGPGRDGMRFSVHKTADHQYVIPADAKAAVAQGRVDRRLFDLTTLTEFGYDKRATVPVIVTGAGANRVATGRGRALPSIDGYAYYAEKGSAWRTLRSARGISKIWLDGKRKTVLDHSVPQIGAPTAWDAGYTGEGIKVAVIDTGVDQTHPDLADREIAEANFTESPDNVDHFGHGTHVASTVAGTGAKSGGKYRGVAPGAQILDAKVLDDFGGGLESWIIGGMEWAAEQGADIANMSLGGGDTAEIDPLEEAVNTLSAEYGTLFVIAAGNSGTDESVGSPGSADAALTVGAVDRDDNLAGFSSRGPRVGDGAIKPDVTAPGVDIVAALHSDGTIGPEVEPGYTALSGTSMATPHVAGAAALLAQQHPDHTGAQLKAILSASAKPHADLTAFEQGAGRIDVARAITQSVVTEPTSVSVGTIQWPHDDDEPVSKTLTYRNLGDTDVTLALALDTDAPAGMFTVSANEVTVPAGGTAEVTVTGDAEVGDVDGYFSAAVVATAGESVTRTPAALYREVESYDLTVNTLDSTGAATGDFVLVLFGHDNGRFILASEEDGSVELRLPKGTYLLDDAVYEGTEEDPRTSLLVQPKLVVDKAMTVTVDARTAKPVSVTPPAAADLLLGDIGYLMMTDLGGLGAAYLTDDVSRISTAHLGEKVPGTAFTAKVNTQWAAADGSYYGLAWFPHGGMPTGFTKVVTKKDVATVRADHGTPTPGRTGGKVLFPSPAEGEGFVFGVESTVELPSRRAEYVTTENTRWQGMFLQYNGDDVEAQFTSPVSTYRAGRTYRTSFNHGVFAPAFTNDGFEGGWIFRFANELYIQPPLFSDSAGNAGFSLLDSASLKLYRDGELVGEADQPSAFFEVPAQDGEYRVVVTANRPADVFDVSTAISAEWTFRSKFVDEETVVPVNASALRFTPRLDAANSAPAGVPFLVPVSSQHNGTGATERPRTLKVEVSYDEGKTWKRADTILNLVAVVHHPADAESVSLRATATDRDGGEVTETVLRAYKLRK
ncbi:S8 family serine peptidase [Actinophytocola sp. NPDC049390]|uniref:S8 family serine peptidase n=1 Tax=Actinophytocola sp. NPDC049390 TaxID=3363894 RepID=UPI0037B8CEA3